MDTIFRFREDTRKMVEALLDYGLAPGTVSEFVLHCRGIERLLECDSDYVSAVLRATKIYMQDHLNNNTSKDRHYIFRQLERRISSFITTGQIDFSFAKRNAFADLSSTFEIQFKGYIADLEKRGMAPSTILKWRSYAHRFLKYLSQNGINDLRDISINNVEDFIVWVSAIHDASGLAGELTMLRSFFSYTDSNEITSNARWFVPGGRYVRSAPVPALTDDELSKVISQVDNSTAIGKRNLAMMLLAIKMGVRSSEITGMLIKDIDWDKGCILIRQKKTYGELLLPAPDDVLDAIADYLLNGRPDSDEEAVFLTSRVPYKPFSQGCELWKMSKPYFEASCILDGKEGTAARSGLHRMRHSAATKMLAAEVPLESMASVLGHTKVETTKTYAQVEEGKLRSCCLPFPKGCCHE